MKLSREEMKAITGGNPLACYVVCGDAWEGSGNNSGRYFVGSSCDGVVGSAICLGGFATSCSCGNA